MTTLPLLLSKAAKYTLHHVREIAYADMARQASGWIPDEARIASTPRTVQPIRLDFAIPKKHRLGWMSRSISQSPR